jgi:hypothetical protein
MSGAGRAALRFAGGESARRMPSVARVLGGGDLARRLGICMQLAARPRRHTDRREGIYADVG